MMDAPGLQCEGWWMEHGCTWDTSACVAILRSEVMFACIPALQPSLHPGPVCLRRVDETARVGIGMLAVVIGTILAGAEQ